MTKTKPTKNTPSKTGAAKTKNTKQQAATTTEPRGARRRRETRTRLLNAAFKLIADRGMDAVAVNEITEEADVGFGSFYNHFESKEALQAALCDQVFEEFADALNLALKEVTDPAEIIATSVRHTLIRARQDPTWGRFLLREGQSSHLLLRGLGVRLMRDIQMGIASSRFNCEDALIAFLAIAGTVLASISMGINFQAAGNEIVAEDLRNTIKLPEADFPEQVAASMLCFLGVSVAEARVIARQPLPDLGTASLEVS